ncbi:Rieske (2Fe-2S) protein [Streptomyces sp. NPDC006879]|uniref:Rieske (2Fe-2S) protein n=1 Tax=Streptomyces sp. NPDC006879 TaxID=3364767 RepID=UPI0036A484B0
MSDITRRRTVLAAGAAAVAATALSACGESTEGGSDTGGSTGGSDTAGSAPGEVAGGVLAQTADIPVGGGKVFKDEKVVVTQPAAGEFKAFSAVCTHQGCLVDKVVDGTIDCPCHGSKFKVADGAVANGPATRALPEAQIKVEGGSITLA